MFDANLLVTINIVTEQTLFQEIVKVFSFHHYENPKHAREKKDPRKEKNATRGLSIVNLLYSASRGDIDALAR